MKNYHKKPNKMRSFILMYFCLIQTCLLASAGSSNPETDRNATSVETSSSTNGKKSSSVTPRTAPETTTKQNENLNLVTFTLPSSAVTICLILILSTSVLHCVFIIQNVVKIWYYCTKDSEHGDNDYSRHSAAQNNRGSVLKQSVILRRTKKKVSKDDTQSAHYQDSNENSTSVNVNEGFFNLDRAINQGRHSKRMSHSFENKSCSHNEPQKVPQIKVEIPEENSKDNKYSDIDEVSLGFPSENHEKRYISDVPHFKASTSSPLVGYSEDGNIEGTASSKMSPDGQSKSLVISSELQTHDELHELRKVHVSFESETSRTEIWCGPKIDVSSTLPRESESEHKEDKIHLRRSGNMESFPKCQIDHTRRLSAFEVSQDSRTGPQRRSVHGGETFQHTLRKFSGPETSV